MKTFYVPLEENELKLSMDALLRLYRSSDSARSDQCHELLDKYIRALLGWAV